MLCPKCGIDNEETARFCRACGTRIERVQTTHCNDISNVDIKNEPVVSEQISSTATHHSDVKETKKYWMLLCVAPVTLIVWSIVSRVFWVSYTEILHIIYNLLDATLWGLLHSSLAITIWNRNKSFSVLWGGIYFVSALANVFMGHAAIVFELMYTIAMLCSGLIIFGIKKCVNNKPKKEIFVALSACVSV